MGRKLAENGPGVMQLPDAHRLFSIMWAKSPKTQNESRGSQKVRGRACPRGELCISMGRRRWRWEGRGGGGSSSIQHVHCESLVQHREVRLNVEVATSEQLEGVGKVHKPGAGNAEP